MQAWQISLAWGFIWLIDYHFAMFLFHRTNCGTKSKYKNNGHML